MPDYFSDAPTLADRRDQRSANAKKRATERKLSSLKHQQEKKQFKPKRPVMIRRSAVKKVGKKLAKRVQRNREYYASAEWRAKRKAVFARDGYRCTETIAAIVHGGPYYPSVGVNLRCENVGEWVNGKQTGKGLVCEEVSYGHRGIPGRIDTCRTRCKYCDRAKTPLERINHAHGFRKVGGGSQ